MLAARDQENLVHGHQAAAASKPLNQGTRQLAPKTPGNLPKTPFKVPLNDENAAGLVGGKMGGRVFTKGLGNKMSGGEKASLTDKFVTPMGPKTRAPLGAKTTNAKAKAFQTPAAGPIDNDLGKTNQRNNSVRKAKPRVSHAEMTKLDILGEGHEVVEPEIEYMPPRAEDMPDLPDDHVELDFSMFENGGLMKGALAYYMTRKGEDGLSHVEREEQRQQKIWDRLDRISDAALQRDIDSEPIPCTHYPECPGDLCKNTIQARKEAEDQYQKTVAEIDAETGPLAKKSPALSGPPTLKTKAATATVSQPKGSALALKAPSKPGVPSARSRLNSNLVSRPQKTALPTNPSPMRHTAATAASKTTMGYSKGRAASATLRKAVLPAKPTKTDENVIPDTEMAPADYIQRYGVPKFGSEMWIRCKRSGCFDEDEGPSLEEIFGGGKPGGIDSYLREEAEQDFQLTF